MKKKLFLVLSIAGICLLCTQMLDQPQTFLMHIMGMETSKQSAVTEEDHNPVIVIDAGHGGYDTGSITQSGLYEKDINLSIALKTGAILESSGYQVVYTRTSDEVTWPSDNQEDLATRVQIAEHADADYYLSIHMNSSEYNDGASGFEIYLDGENETILEMASRLESSLSSLGYTLDRGIKTTQESSLYVIDKNSVPAMLVEFGFLSDTADAQYLVSSEGQEQLANCLAESVQKNVGL